MLQQLIDRYKNYRKQTYLDHPARHKHAYAFVGVGNHSISNLYPCLDFLAVPLKIICSRSASNAEKMAKRYPGAKGTADINDIINDPSIRGVFVCYHPSTHFQATKKLLESGKKVFVEKPPCTTAKELQVLMQAGNRDNCLIGVQKRYSTINQLLKKQVKDVISYNYRYVTGAYPEGNAVLDLFIHPIDTLVFLFGKVKDITIRKASGEKSTSTYLLITEHESGTTGMVELSTAYSWNTPEEQLIITSGSKIYEANYPYRLTATGRQKELLGIPLEKILKTPVRKEVLYNVNGFVPVKENNALYVQGYYHEIATFLKMTEGNNSAKNVSSPQDLEETYRLIELITR